MCCFVGFCVQLVRALTLSCHYFTVNCFCGDLIKLSKTAVAIRNVNVMIIIFFCFSVCVNVTCSVNEVISYCNLITFPLKK